MKILPKFYKLFMSMILCIFRQDFREADNSKPKEFTPLGRTLNGLFPLPDNSGRQGVP